MIFRRIGRVFRRVVSVGKKIFNTVKKTVSDIVKNPLALARKVLDKLPIPKVITGFVQKFMNSPFAALLPGPIAAIGSLLLNAKTGGDIFDIVRGVASSPAFQAGPPAARNNIFQMAAAAQARILFPGMFN